MKKFVLLIYNDSRLLDAMPAAKFDATMRDCLAHADELRDRGRLLDTQMLSGADTARSVRVRAGRRTIVDGPYTETKELLAGFNVIEAENMEEALRIAEQFPWVETGCVEVREIIDVDTVRARVNSPPRTHRG